MGAEESRVAKALKLVDTGVSKAEAAKECGISRQAVDDALKRREARAALAEQARTCSECGAPLPAGARVSMTTCSRRCRTAKSRRVAKEKAGEVDLLGNPMTPIDADQFEQARKRGEAKAAARALGIERKRLGLLKA